MLRITIPSTEFWDEVKQEFVYTKAQTLQLEHSLVSLSKWESRWNKPFLTKQEKTLEETIDYVKCMTLTQNVNPEVYNYLTNSNINEVNKYIALPMTATRFFEEKKTQGSREQITAELIYYAGADRSYDQFTNPYVIFSPKFENVINTNYLESKKTLKTVTLVAGEGEGADRRTTTVACASGAGTGLNRRELYTDARDVSSTVDNETLTDAEYNAQLSQRGLENLAENIATKSFEGKVETTRMYRYGEDFFLGDMIQIVNEYGIEGKARVTEFIRSQSKEGLDSYPTFVTVE